MIKAMATVMAASLALGIVPLPASMLDKAGVTMTSEATAYGSEAVLSFSASSVDWASDAGQEPVRALDRNPGTMWRVYRKSPTSGGLFIQFAASQKFTPTSYTFTTAPDAATNPKRNPNSWTLYAQNPGGGSWVALNSQTDNGGMQDVNSATYQFNLPSNGSKYSLYRIEFSALNSDVMALADIRLYGNNFETAESDKTYTVSFNTDGGSRVSSQDVRSGNKVSEPSTPTRDGYRFTGWYTSRSLSTYYDFSRKVYEDMTLYAGWEAKTVNNDAEMRAKKEAEEAKQKAAEAEAARIKAEQEAASEKAKREAEQAAEKARREQEAKEEEEFLKELQKEIEEQERIEAEEEQKKAREEAERLQKEADEAAAREAEEAARREQEEEERRLAAAAEAEAAAQAATETASAEDEEVVGEGALSATVNGNGGVGTIAGIIALLIAAAGGLVFWNKKKNGANEE